MEPKIESLQYTHWSFSAHHYVWFVLLENTELEQKEEKKQAMGTPIEAISSK